MISITAHHWIWPGRESKKLSRGRVKNVDPARYGMQTRPSHDSDAREATSKCK